MQKLILTFCLALAFVISSAQIKKDNHGFSKFDSSNKEEKNKALSNLYGNWYNPKTNSWEYGFFEDFAIINGDFFDYKSVSKEKNAIKIHLISQNNKEIVLTGTVQKDELFLKTGKNKSKLLRIDKFLKNDPTVDHRLFYDSEFKGVDTTTVTGYLRNSTSNAPVKISIHNWLKDENDNYFADVDSLGRFSVKIPMINTTQVYMLLTPTSFIRTVLEPGKKYSLFNDLDSKQLFFAGTDVRVQNELARYDDFIFDKLYKSMTADVARAKYNQEQALRGDDFLSYKMKELDSLKYINSLFLNNYTTLSDRTKYYIDKNTDFQIASKLMQKKFSLDRNKKEHFSELYMQTVTDNFYDKLKPTSLLQDNATFLRDYISYKKEMDSTSNKLIYYTDVIDYLIINKKINVTPEVVQYSHLISDRESNKKNKLLIEDLLKKDSTIRHQYNLIDKQYQDLIAQRSSLCLRVINPLQYFSANLSPELRDIFHTENILKFLKSEPVPLDEQTISEITEPINNSYFVGEIKASNNSLLKLSKSSMQYEDNLRRTEHLKSSKDADKLLAEILTPHKGKVVYIDFWGTWCSPCVAEMEYVPALKKALEGKDVVFIYFANRTPKDAWKNFIKRKDLEGKNVIHYNLDEEQQRSIETRLGINAFPSYLLLNKNGEFVNMKAPRPSEKERLTKEIDKLLLE
ncbi:TlpA family protein disulfide reductase [Sphingobacterium kitahiroshimense]|uniref:TlpA family protein disulfide reductase n=1 Tax=Sphingobacterium sp. B16(2022) TaxID=2914044 RepID=UPI00143A4EA0|nr:TlpA disulfide reductase family protein [Sphingobacterium sp. B16(2022)]NJI72230.1 TlpA family protein disulfide reductase [Sphingobacterium sp. B16(2022)]